MTNPSSKQVEPELKSPERIRLVKRDGILDGHWYYPDAAIMPFDAEIEYTRLPVAGTAPRVDQQDNDEIRLALEGMIAAFDVSNYGDASIVATTRECALSIAKRAVGWTFAPPAPKEEEAWLIEKMLNGNVHYISANYVLEWTDDPNKALRLARREDAEALCTIVEDADKITEHEWLPAPPLVSDCDPDG